ncbi:MAG: hypothetical protein V7459_03820 [Oceanicoccus sp.]
MQNGNVVDVLVIYLKSYVSKQSGLSFMEILVRVMFSFGIAICITSCVSLNTSEPEASDAVAIEAIECTEPRSQVCTREYMPVCAAKDTGIQCVTTPCPAIKKVTYATACTACADPMVRYYTEGQCEL